MTLASMRRRNVRDQVQARLLAMAGRDMEIAALLTLSSSELDVLVERELT